MLSIQYSPSLTQLHHPQRQLPLTLVILQHEIYTFTPNHTTMERQSQGNAPVVIEPIAEYLCTFIFLHESTLMSQGPLRELENALRSPSFNRLFPSARLVFPRAPVGNERTNRRYWGLQPSHIKLVASTRKRSL